MTGFSRGGGAAEDPAYPSGEILAFRDGTPCARSVVTGRPVRFTDLDGVVPKPAWRPGASGVLAAAGLSWFLCVPLTTRGLVHGFLVFGRSTTAGRFTDRDVDMARELSAVAAVSIDNALLYRREQRIAEALQRGLLPGDLATPDGIEVTHRYQPPGGQIVGGDWCDIIPLPNGRSALIVGDAMGHGAEAATVMAQLRAAANALAALDLPPATVLQRLDEMAARLSTATFATCVYASRPGGRGMRDHRRRPPAARAGHPGRQDGSNRHPGRPAAWAGGGDVRCVEVPLPPGAVLALYTDGLVESRVRPFDEGVEALCDALAGCQGPLPGICDAVVGKLWERGEDDTTLVLARIPAPRTAPA